MTYDVIVLGVGATGSAAALHLAARGLRVLALESFGIAHAKGSSHGHTRIIRLAYFEHPSYVPLLRRAFELWRDLESRAKERLLHVTGSIDAGPVGSRTLEGSVLSCQTHHLPHELLTSAQITSRFPGYRLPADTMAVFQPDGGFLLPEACVAAHARLAEAAGAHVRAHERAWQWQATDDGAVLVETERGTYSAGQLVIAAGAWTPRLVPALQPLLTVERQVVAWFEVADRDLMAPARFPVFILDHDGEQWYGFPEFGVPGFKVGLYHHLREGVDPDAFDRDEVTSADLKVLRPLVERCFPAAGSGVLSAATCMFTNAPDGDFVIDRLPDHPQVLVTSACSGHGFKFATVIGEIVADLVQRGATDHDISRFRLSRFS